MALGASGQNVFRSVILTESKVIGVGILFGLGAAAAGTRALETVLFGVTTLDPLTLIVSVTTLGGVALLAVLHYDFWYWDDTSLLFGFMPIGLAYHAVFSLACVGVWFLAVTLAWPRELEEWADVGDEEAA